MISLRRPAHLVTGAAIALFGAAGAAQAVPANLDPVCAGTSCSVSFPYVGDSYAWTVPNNIIGPLTLDVQGAAGGGYDGTLGGRGAQVTGSYTAASGTVLTVSPGGQGVVGAGGWNGGAPGVSADYTQTNFLFHVRGGGGGGASDIRVGGTALANRVVVAGGGGGANVHWGTAPSSGPVCINCEYTRHNAVGGNSGRVGTDGAGWTNANGSHLGGRGATQAAGGAGGYFNGVQVASRNAGAGMSGTGGASTATEGAGGGGGYFGGGGGTYANSAQFTGGAGGGGSSYATAAVSGVAYTAGAQSGNGVITISYTVAMAPTFVADTPPMWAMPGAAFSYQFTATGNPAPTFSVSAGTLPTGLSLSWSGALTGTPTATGTYKFAVTAANASGSVASDTISMTIGTAPMFTTATPPATAQVGMPFSYRFAAAGSPSPVISVASGALPDGLTLTADATTGSAVLSGTPTTAGTSTFTLAATNAGGTDTTTVSLQVMAATPMMGTAQMTVGPGTSGDTGRPMTAAVQLMAPDGARLNSANARIYANPTLVARAQAGLISHAGGLVLIGRGSKSAGSGGARALNVMVKLNATGTRLAHRYYDMPVVISYDTTNSAGQKTTAQTMSNLSLAHQTIAPAGGTFGTLQTNLDPAGVRFVNSVTRLVKTMPRNITCYGYADERGTWGENLWLGQQRAITVCDALRAKGVKARSWDVVSRGSSFPRATGMNAAAWAKNRRVEVAITR